MNSAPRLTRTSEIDARDFRPRGLSCGLGCGLLHAPIGLGPPGLLLADSGRELRALDTADVDY